MAGIPLLKLSAVEEVLDASLATMGVQNVWDLLTFYPRRYIDRTREAQIADLDIGEEGTLLVEVMHVRSIPQMRGKRSRVEVRVRDTDGSQMVCVFFNQPWRERQLKKGMEITIFGKLTVFGRRRTMANPVVDLLGTLTRRVVPVYPQSETARVSSRDIAPLVAETLRRCEGRGIHDPVSSEILKQHDLCSRAESFKCIHVPESIEAMHRGRKRLVFDELFRMQLFLALRKQEARSGAGFKHQLDRELILKFWESLPFRLTSSQRRAFGEILQDMLLPEPMQRLLHGEVGSGKTVVALSAMLAAAASNFQSALMVPTEVLAEQHFSNLSNLLGIGRITRMTAGGRRSALGINLELLTGATRKDDRARVLSGLLSGEVDMVVGTHALISEGVEFNALSLVIIDEQHRFGVEQRALLRAKARGKTPDVLVMTATPIPRTAAMSVYGDLDISKIDEMPLDRAGFSTKAVWDALGMKEAWEHLRAEVASGRQAYVVCPLIDESESVEASAANVAYKELSQGQFSDLRLALMHGRVPRAQRENVFEEFACGNIDVLVSTTMIEVGVDVPNATVMIVLGAERFGMAQLHQLRGRVGRGSYPGSCYLVSGSAGLSLGFDSLPLEGKSPRIEALVETADGFQLAEIDLEIRGEGTLMSKHQTGRSDLKLASLRRDKDWVERARTAARELVENGAVSSELKDELSVCLASDDAEYLEKT